MTTASLGARAQRLVVIYLAITAIVLALLMLFGVVMRGGQGGLIALSPALFYQLMTAHGIGMVAIAGFGGSAVMWYFLSQYVDLSPTILLANLVFFLIGVVCVLGGVFVGGYASGWTFLYPLPGNSLGVWGPGAAAAVLVGVLLVGVGFLLLFLDAGRAIIGTYGSLPRALGWPQAFGGSNESPPPPAVVASTVVTIVNVLSITVGAVILVVSLVSVYVPSFAINALLAKNLIFFFGHVFINAAIYMAVIAVYEVLPRYTGRPWKTSKPFLYAWTATLLMVLAVYPHHLLMDFAMPRWAVVMGQVVSYTSALPVLAVTAVGTLALVHRSGIKWDMASGLLFVSVMGWSVGVVPAVLDGTIAINRVMHNTLWVPGHFHIYLLLGVVAMLFGFMYFLGTQAKAPVPDSGLDRAGFWVYVVGALGFSMMFLASGVSSVPRRFAVHLAPWIALDQWGTLFAVATVLACLVFVARLLQRAVRIVAS